MLPFILTVEVALFAQLLGFAFPFLVLKTQFAGLLPNLLPFLQVLRASRGGKPAGLLDLFDELVETQLSVGFPTS